ncbi:hypothetical protein [Pusillimonas sp. ANT_WB101]|uniref:hypothetical protein n=1 Tax=Pusillimonas sp. ANT_WB101 TaxID=2597356 RepID=UPI0011ED862B|nr:hypothetical protein [Pusillimonas sp. ANT_WB101]KAA0889957.1 hypothetical protein FQ179_16520 [Pusillimonas sp. ANT_WB101]
MYFKKLLAISLALLGCGASQAAFSAESESWKFEVTPYFFAAGMNGKVGIRGVTSDVDASFSDILKNLDQGFMGLVTASKGRWTYGLEALYVKLDDNASKSVTGPFGHVGVKGALGITSKLYVYQGSVAYRVFDNAVSVDLLGALRYTKVYTKASVNLSTTPGIVFPGGSRSASGSASWTDAVVGTRVFYPVSDKFSLFGYADIGGGGSDLTYQFMLGADWHFAKNFTAKLGYRQLYWDYSKGGDVWKMRVSGPYLGLGISF